MLLMFGLETGLRVDVAVADEAAPSAAADKTNASSEAPPGEVLPEGVEIARRVNGRKDGETLSQRLIMELVDRRGKKRIREMLGFRKDYPDERRIMLVYESPKNVRGTSFLTYDYIDPEREDDQRLYLPGLRKVRRIPASKRGASFQGSDFTYEDLKGAGKAGVEDYGWKTVGVETVEGHRCYVVEAIPVDAEIAEELGYGRVLSRVDAEIWMVRKLEVWDVNQKPLKVVEFRDIRSVNEIWTAHRIEARNQKTGHSSSFTFSDVEYGVELADDLFTEKALLRGH